MAITHTVTHPFVSLKADGSDASLVQPGDWNADHTVVHTCAGNVVLGRQPGAAGAVQELSLGSGFTVSGGEITVPTVFPVGVILDYGGGSAPSGWLICGGALISRATYSALFAVIGESFGAGDGSSTFALPDFRGRAAFGRDSMGGSTAGRITSAGSGIAGTTLGASGGTEDVTLDSDQLPSHRHTISQAGGHIHYNVADGSTTGTAAMVANESIVRAHDSYTLDGVSSPAPTLGETSEVDDHTHTAGLTGGDEAHTNMPPALIVTKIIYTGV